MEVKPAGINKGTFVSIILGYLKNTLDFSLVVGDDKGDEQMFLAQLNDKGLSQCDAIFSVVVGIKPTKAKYYF